MQSSSDKTRGHPGSPVLHSRASFCHTHSGTHGHLPGLPRCTGHTSLQVRQVSQVLTPGISLGYGPLQLGQWYSVPAVCLALPNPLGTWPPRLSRHGANQVSRPGLSVVIYLRYTTRRYTCGKGRSPGNVRASGELLGFLQSTSETQIFPECLHRPQRLENPECGWIHASPPSSPTLLQGDKLQGPDLHGLGYLKVGWGQEPRSAAFNLLLISCVT